MARQAARTLDQVEAELDSEAKKETTEKRSAPKELVIERHPNGLYFIRYTAGGEVPDGLKGSWTSCVKAEAAIANYKATQAQQQQAA